MTRALLTQALSQDDVTTWASLMEDVALHAPIHAESGTNWAHQAAFGGAEQCLTWLLNRDASLAQSVDAFGRTPLHLAVMRHQSGCARVALGQAAAVDALDQGRSTPLHWACHTGAPVELVRTLLDAGAHPNRYDGHSLSPLHLAAQGGHEAVVQLLLERGAHLEARDLDGCTPLLIAAREGQAATYQALLAQGADRTVQDKRGRDAETLWSGWESRAVVNEALAQAMTASVLAHAADAPHPGSMVWQDEVGAPPMAVDAPTSPSRLRLKH